MTKSRMTGGKGRAMGVGRRRAPSHRAVPPASSVKPILHPRSSHIQTRSSRPTRLRRGRRYRHRHRKSRCHPQGLSRTRRPHRAHGLLSRMAATPRPPRARRVRPHRLRPVALMCPQWQRQQQSPRAARQMWRRARVRSSERGGSSPPSTRTHPATSTIASSGRAYGQRPPSPSHLHHPSPSLSSPASRLALLTRTLPSPFP